jgi:hypothetical protein
MYGDMLSVRKLVSILVVTACSMNLSGSPVNDDSLRYEVLLTPSMIDVVDPEANFINSVDITSDELLLLSTRDQFYLVGWGGIIPVGKKNLGDIYSFGYTSDNLLMTIRNNELCLFNQSGDLRTLYTLPGTEMGISRGKYGMYIFDRNGSKPRYAVYVIAHGGMYSKMFEVPKPVYSIVEQGNSILFTNGNTIYSYSPGTRNMKALVSLPEDKTIRSMTVDHSSGRIFLSTDNMVFSVMKSEPQLITDKMGGNLFYFNGLIIFNPENKYLVRIVGPDDKRGLK